MCLLGCKNRFTDWQLLTNFGATFRNMNKVFFKYADRTLLYTNKTKVKKAIENLFIIEKKTLKHLVYVFCSDGYLLSLNQSFLNHNTYTDIITFNLSETSKEIIAEIYISIDRVKENAKTYETTFANELERVIFHGALHLCGYKDKSKEDVLLMRLKENHYLTIFLSL